MANKKRSGRYRAILTYDSAQIPPDDITLDVLEDTIVPSVSGFPIAFTREGVGLFRIGNFAFGVDYFVPGKTIITIGEVSLGGTAAQTATALENSFAYAINDITTEYIDISVNEILSGVPISGIILSDDGLYKTPIEIKVYP